LRRAQRELSGEDSTPTRSDIDNRADLLAADFRGRHSGARMLPALIDAVTLDKGKTRATG
jgi:hypothetical protein